MSQLRWSLGLPPGLFIVGWIALVLLADRFRSSFGATPNAAWKLVLPIAVAGMLLLSVVLPVHRGVLHGTAAVVLVVSIGALAIFRQAPFLAACWLAYAVAWLAYYRLHWNAPSLPPIQP